MSDFLFTSRREPEGFLAASLRRCSKNGEVIAEYHGRWGSLAVVPNHYAGYGTVIDEDRITVVLGGPLIRGDVGERTRMAGADSHARIIHEMLKEPRKSDGKSWFELLNYPFAVFSLDKTDGSATVITDPMLFVPVYYAGHAEEEGAFVTGSFLESVAQTAGRFSSVDTVSLTDYLIHAVVAWPHTIYDSVLQAEAGSVWRFGREGIGKQRYWTPRQRKWDLSRGETAELVRGILQRSLESVCNGKREVGVLLSGGMDSRVVLGALPQGLDVQAYTITEGRNREAGLAERIAARHGISHVSYQRASTHYVDNLEESCSFLGCQDPFIHAHTFGIAGELDLLQKEAVFGGLFCDGFLKASHVSSERRFGVGPRRVSAEQRVRPRFDHSFFQPELVEEVWKRWQAHTARLQELVPESAVEYTMLYPSTMCPPSAYYTCNRRQFRSYEPFMDFDLVDACISIPAAWKLQNRIFREAFLPLMNGTGFIPNSNGTLPALGPLLNAPLSWLYKVRTKAERRICKLRGEPFVEHGSWPRTDRLVRMPAMLGLFEKHVGREWSGVCRKIMATSPADFFGRSSPQQQMSLLQFMCTRNPEC